MTFTSVYDILIITEVIRLSFENIINVIVNNSVAVGVIIYFLYRDNKWTAQLQKSLDALQSAVCTVKELVETHIERSDSDHDKSG